MPNLSTTALTLTVLLKSPIVVKVNSLTTKRLANVKHKEMFPRVKEELMNYTLYVLEYVILKYVVL